MITYALGGRAAEEARFRPDPPPVPATTSSGHRARRKMVCEWGMSDKLGPLAYGAKEEEIFLGREITRSRNFSEDPHPDRCRGQEARDQLHEACGQDLARQP